MTDHSLSTAQRAMDWLLDRSIALGYSRIGYAVRHRWWTWQPSPSELADRVVLVTGATSGIGFAAARALGDLGATVHVLGHDSEHLSSALARLQTEVPQGTFVGETCDLTDLDEVRQFAGDFADRVPRLHGLAHNAGTMAQGRQQSPQGHEGKLALHVLTPFLLTTRLRPILAADGDARVVFVSSGGMYAQPLRDDDPEYRQGSYNAAKSYARTKRFQVVLAQLFHARLREDHITVQSMHPGWVETRGVRAYLPKFRALSRPLMRTPEQGADTLVWLLAAAGAVHRGGAFWHDRLPRPTSYGRPRRQTPLQEARLWDYCERATN